MIDENELQQLQSNYALVSHIANSTPELGANVAHSIALFIEKNPEIMQPLFTATTRGWILSFAAAVGEKPLSKFISSCGVNPTLNNVSVFLFKLGSAFGGWWLDGTFERKMMNVMITNAIFIAAFAYWSKTHPYYLADGTRLRSDERNQIVHYKSSAVTILGSAVTRQLIAAHFFSKNPLTIEQAVNMFLGVLGSIGGSVFGFGLGKVTMWTFEKISSGFSSAIVKMNSCANSCYRMFPSVRRYMPMRNEESYSYELHNFKFSA